MAARLRIRCMAIAEILSTLKDREGHIHIPGFYDRVVPPSDKERAAWARLPFDESEYKEKEVGVKELVGEPEIPLFERLWARPTLEVHGIRGGFIGEGAKTVIPARALAKISLRLVADQKPDEATAQLKKAVAAACPKGVTAEYKPIHNAPPSLVNPDNRFIQAAAEAMKQVFGKETVYIRSGGSIPIVAAFDEHLGIPERHDGLRLAGRQSARAQRKAASAEFLPRHRGRGALYRNSRRLVLLHSDVPGPRHSAGRHPGASHPRPAAFLFAIPAVLSAVFLAALPIWVPSAFRWRG